MFEPHAIVWAEEPRDIGGAVEAAAALGARQRPGHAALSARLARGRRAGRLGGVSFALIWFSVFLMPALHGRSRRPSLVTLFLLDREFSRRRVPRAVGDQPRHLPVRDALELLARSAGRARAAGARAFDLPRPDQPGDHRLRLRPASSTRALGPRHTASIPAGLARLLLFAYVWLVGLDARRLRRASASRSCAGCRGSRARCSTSSATGRCCARSPPPAYVEEVRRRGDGVGEDREDRRGRGPGVSDGFERRPGRRRALRAAAVLARARDRRAGGRR